MVKGLSILVLMIGLSTNSWSQQQMGFMIETLPTQWRTPGLLSASATYAPSVGLADGLNGYHLHGFAEYHISRRISVKSDSYLFLNRPLVTFFNEDMFRSYFGAFYHLNTTQRGNWDVKFGLLPGVTYVKRTPWVIDDEQDTFTKVLAPSVSTAAGFDFYVWKYFHFFSQVSYVHSNVRGFPNGSLQLDEVIFSAGLGFQIPTIR
jgi:hypothetical protein